MTGTDSEQKKAVFASLLENGCCVKCALRFVTDDFSNVHNLDEQQVKKVKPNPCVICLDLLQDVTIDTMVSHTEVHEALAFDSDTFVNFISFPMAVLIREHSMVTLAKEKFAEFFEDRVIIPINKAWSLSIQEKLSQKLNKKFNKHSPLHIQFTTSYKFEEEESSVMLNLRGKDRRGALSRNNVGEYLKTVDPDLFKKHVLVLSNIPTNALTLQEVLIKHDCIFVAGRYRKYSRNLFQTPWVTEDEQVMPSVQQIIFDGLGDTFKAQSLIFTASGREDFDVRTLGRGRPFFIRVCDPKVTKISFEKLRSIEKAIKKTKVVEIRDLQFIDRKFVNNIKDGEQFKKKTYRALCVIDKPDNLTEYINKISNCSNVILEQSTPLRVFHRRTSDCRKREIYSMEARPITGRDNLFEMDLLTQAGTYIKEFIHGDLGRTVPSLGDIIGGFVDIIALDVLDIHLDFPPRIENQKCLNNK